MKAAGKKRLFKCVQKTGYFINLCEAIKSTDGEPEREGMKNQVGVKVRSHQVQV